MRIPSIFALAFCLFLVGKSSAQTGKIFLKDHVQFLADDRLEGRLAGSKNERKAAKYIIKHFKDAGLEPMSMANDFRHPFTFYTPLKEGKNNHLKVNGAMLSSKDYLPMPYSSSGEANGQVLDLGFGIHAPELGHDDYNVESTLKGKVFLINLGSPDGIHPHSKFTKYHGARERVKMALSLTPSAIVFHSSEKDMDRRMLKAFNNVTREQVPIVYVSDSAALEQLKKKNTSVSLSVDLFQEERTGHNVLGYLDNGADRMIVIGAHYDHLGYNEYGNSLFRGEPQIHNGADDNASGTAMMLELARRISKNQSLKGSNYLFVAFSAEELGLLGSGFLAKSKEFSELPVICMLNYDMVGRLDKNERNLGLHGTGTSPVWDSLVKIVDGPKFEISKEQSGMGSSDHTSFYLRDIPVLSFFTGSHEDYHKPSDDADKINYAGMEEIASYSMELLEHLDDIATIPFTKTSDSEGRKAPRFSVTLGIVPDYFGKVEGLKVDGVSEGKPASKAGLKPGDIIVRLGDIEVKDIMGYMEALSAFKKGDKTEVEVLRDNKPQVFKLAF